MFSWTDERIEELKGMVALNMSGRQIGDVFGTTRNSVVGKCCRLGLTLNGTHPLSGVIGNTRKSANPKIKRAKREFEFGVRVFQPRSRSFTPKVTPMPVEPLNIPTIALEEHHCRQVTSGEGEPYHFCGHPKALGSFCSFHAAINYLPAPPPKPRHAYYGKRFAA